MMHPATHPTLLIPVIALLAVGELPAQDSATQKRRREKIETILRIQDSRTPHDGALRSFLDDPDTLVRIRATLACGSLQDTSLLGLLVRNLTGAPLPVQEQAAFAIGQTGIALSEPGRRLLGDDLLRNRLFATGSAERLIEEIGKFGTRETLDDLMIRVGNTVPVQYKRGLTMAIARFAIRTIVSDDAVRFLLRELAPPDAVSWETAYALQRVGDHPLVRADAERLVLLRKHGDPRVRIAAATILGNLRGEPAITEPLLVMAGFDGDWRVRVSALRALGAAGLGRDMQGLRTLRVAFNDDNEHVAITALAVCGSGGALSQAREEEADVVHQLRLLAENPAGNFPWQIQGEAAVALARCTGRDALPSLHPEDSREPRLRARIIEALGYTSDTSSVRLLLRTAALGDPIMSTAALHALSVLASSTDDSLLIERTYGELTLAARSADLALAATAASLMREPAFRRSRSVDVLRQSLATRRIPDDIEVLQETIATLSQLGDPGAIPLLRDLLRLPDQSVARAAVAALRELTGTDYSASIPKRTGPLWTDYDFATLFSLPDTVLVRIETIRGDITAELYPFWSPFSVMNLLKLTSQRGLYHGVPFHRVVPNFVIQGGDPRGDGWGGPGYTIRSEFSPLRYETGTVGLASAGKDTEGSQFFITHSPQPHLDGRYTIVGRVIRGQEVVDRIQVGERLFDIAPFTGNEGE